MNRFGCLFYWIQNLMIQERYIWRDELSVSMLLQKRFSTVVLLQRCRTGIIFLLILECPGSKWITGSENLIIVRSLCRGQNFSRSTLAVSKMPAPGVLNTSSIFFRFVSFYWQLTNFYWSRLQPSLYNSLFCFSAITQSPLWTTSVYQKVTSGIFLVR